MLPLMLHGALALALIESFGLAVLLWLRARGVPGVGYLSLFLVGVGLWIAGVELPNWFGSPASEAGRWLIALSPLTSAVFLQFVLIFCRTPAAPWTMRAGYALCALTTAAAIALSPGRFVPWQGIEHFFLPHAMGWVLGALWAALAIAGHGVMLLAWLRLRGQRRRQVFAMCLSSGLGALSMSGYAFLPLGLDLFPYPLLLLPAYPLILVYGILRYQLMVVNAWARRALAWALVVATGSVLIVALATLTMPFGGLASGWRLWAASVVALLITSLLLAPFRRLASRIVYPGADLSDGDIQQWRRSLWQPVSFAELQAAATAELSGRLRLPIRVGLGEAAHVADDGTPALVCRPSADGWCTELAGWQAAPPGARYVAQMFGSVLADAAHRLEQAEAFAARERERQKQDRLAELGALAATVAHDIRNPLNIIAMAAAMAPPPLRQEIGVQTQRIAQLATDLLDYARSWQVERRPMDLARHVQDVAASYSGIEIGNGLAIPLQVSGDDRRLRQALVNLLDNARAAADGDGRIGVDAARTADGGVALHVCDRGAGIPDEIRETLFQPFVSRRPDGTGLGLAIVAKVMEAHGGSASLTDRAGWTTCFTLTFPAPGHS